MNPAKPQLLTDSFQIPKRGGKKKERNSTSLPKDTKKPTRPKEPRPRRAPLTPEEARERKRVRTYANYENAKAVGQCRKCEEKAIPGQTRCETHAEEHRIDRRKNDAKRYASKKESKAANVSTKQQTSVAPRPLTDPQATEAQGSTVDETMDGQTSIPKEPSGSKEYQRRYQGERRAKRIAQGICVDSGRDDHKAAPGKTRCDECAETHRVRRRKNDADRRIREKAERQLN